MSAILMIIVVTSASSAKFYTKLAYEFSPYSKMDVVQDIKVGIQVERTLPGKTEEKIFSTHLF